MTSDPLVELKCPECGRWLHDAKTYGRVICRDCGCEVTYRSRAERRTVENLQRGLDNVTKSP